MDNDISGSFERTINELKEYIKFTDGVYSALNDQIQYKKIVLKNNLKIMLVSDYTSDISSALMYVGVGSKDNPNNHDGLAHFLEHMLFMGSDLYPGGTFFHNQVTKHGGSTNAFTTDTSTQYFFSATDNFIVLLKIFSRFFVKPMFDIKWVEKEVDAVDSEHKKNIGSDAWRVMNLTKTLYDDGINNRFATGTRETLLINNDVEKLRDTLISFYESYYSSDNMILYISHNPKQNEMQEIMNMFEEIPLSKVKLSNLVLDNNNKSISKSRPNSNSKPKSRTKTKAITRTRTYHTTQEFEKTNGNLLEGLDKEIDIRKEIQNERFHDAKFKETNGTEIMNIKTVNEDTIVTFNWLLNGTPYYIGNINNSGYDILLYILNSSDVGGLYDLLKDSEYVTNMSASFDAAFTEKAHITINCTLRKDSFVSFSDAIATATATAKTQDRMPKEKGDSIDVIVDRISCIINFYLRDLEGLMKRYKSIFESFYNEYKTRAILGLQITDKLDGLDICQLCASAYETHRIDISVAPISAALMGDMEKCERHFNKCLEEMQIHNCKIVISSSTFNNDELPSIDKHYGTPYKRYIRNIDVDNDKMKSLYDKYNEQKCKLYSDFSQCVPVLNPYLQAKPILRMIDPIAPDDKNYRRIKSKWNNLYYVKKGNIYKSVLACAYINIALECLMADNVTDYAIMLMYVLYMSKLKEIETDNMTRAKIGVSFNVKTDGLIIGINGYNGNYGIDHFFDVVTNWYYGSSKADINTYIYEIVYNDIITRLQSYDNSDAYTMIAPEFTTMINDKHTYTNSQLLEVFKSLDPILMKQTKSKINYNNLATTVVRCMSKGNIVGVFGGSVNIKQITNIITKIESIVAPLGLNVDPLDSTSSSVTSLNKQKNVVQNNYTIANLFKFNEKTKINKNPNNSEKAIGYGLYLGNASEANTTNYLLKNYNWKIHKPYIMLFESFISERFSAYARTERQVGYIAICTIINVGEKHNPELYLVFAAQSNRPDMDEIVKDYVEKQLILDIRDIKSDDFDDMIKSGIIGLSDPPINISRECSETLGTILTTHDLNELINATDDKLIKDRLARKDHMIDALKNSSIYEFKDFIELIHKNAIRSIIHIDHSN